MLPLSSLFPLDCGLSVKGPKDDTATGAILELSHASSESPKSMAPRELCREI